MLNKLNSALNIIMGSFVGVFLGRGLFVVWEYKTHPGLYAMQSAPWYTSILVNGVFTVVLLAVAAVMKLIVQKKLKQS